MAEQARLQASKENFQAAYDAAVSQKEEAENNYKLEKDEGFTQDNFEMWAVQNAPAYAAAMIQYQGARATYLAALSAVNQQAAQAWQEKIRQASIKSNGSLDPNTLIGPDA